MTLGFRIRKAVDEVAPLLAQVHQDSPELLEGFPRSVEEIAVIAGGEISVHIAKIENLTEAKAARYLEEQFQLRHPELNPRHSGEYLGLLAGLGARVFIFCDPGLGEACFRFTLAHELGHLFNEYMPKFLGRNQLDLFSTQPESPRPHRDSLQSVAEGLEGTLDELRRIVEQRRTRGWSLEEVKANAFAAELLAPEKEVRRLVAGLSLENERVARVAERFGLSRRAAEIRVDELIAPERVGWLFGI